MAGTRVPGIVSLPRNHHNMIEITAPARRTICFLQGDDIWPGCNQHIDNCLYLWVPAPDIAQQKAGPATAEFGIESGDANCLCLRHHRQQ